MATRIPSITMPMRGVVVVVWSGLLNGDVGDLVKIANYQDKSIQFFGTFGAGGTIIFQGTNELSTPANAIVLTDPQGNAISKTVASIEAVLENTLWVRPSVTAGDGTTNLTAILVAVSR